MRYVRSGSLHDALRSGAWSLEQIVRLWDAATGQEVRRLSGHTDAITDMAFSPYGKRVLTSSIDGTARLWRTDIQDVIRLACSVLRRDLSAEERATYSIADAAPSCPKA
jgi:WD40 repeat protein